MIKKSLISLSFGAFAIGMTEFTMMGILPDIAKDLNIDIPAAGHLIALYALHWASCFPYCIFNQANVF